MSGWDAVKRVTLAEPWQDFWVEVYLDPPMGAYLDMQAAVETAKRLPNEASITGLLATMPALIAEHNMTNRDGTPLTWEARALGARLVKAISDAIVSVIDEPIEGGEPADPLLTKPGNSPGSASRRSRSPRNTRSGGSRA